MDTGDGLLRELRALGYPGGVSILVE